MLIDATHKKWALAFVVGTLASAAVYVQADTRWASKVRTVAGLRFDALSVDYDHGRWVTDFLDAWPPGSPAYRNYHHRIEHGTWLTPEHAARGTVTCSA